jgi:hypothetical protein
MFARFNRICLCLPLLMLHAPAIADELMVSLGLFNLAPNSRDIEVMFRQERSPWVFGLRHLEAEDLFTDPFTGNQHSKTNDRMTGPVVYYLFSPETPGSIYAGLSLLIWTRTETPLLTADPATSTTRIDPYFGMGYMGKLGEHGFYNGGFFLAPTARMSTQTAISSTEDNAHFDIQLHLGLVW